MKQEKKIKIITGVLMVGAIFIVAFAYFPEISRAGFFGDVYNFFKDGIVKPLNSDEKSDDVPQNQQVVELYKPAYDYEQALITAVEKASPAVVAIVVSKDIPVLERCPINIFRDVPEEFMDFFGGGVMYGQCETGTEKKEVGGGSGFIVSSDGLIVTNKHVVIENGAEYAVFTNDGERHDAKVLAKDPINDLAVLKIETTGLQIAELGDSDSIKLGQTAIAIGNALGEFRNTVSAGVISGLARDITAKGSNGFTEDIEGVIQTDAAINEGNSGGPLLNLKGEVIGINTAIVSGAQNIGFAIPINQAKRAIESVKLTGEIKTTYLGVRYIMITEAFSKEQKLAVDYGALVRGNESGPAVISGSPAESADIRAEDIIIEINGKKIDSSEALGVTLQKYSVGEEIALTVMRGGEKLTLKVVLGERPKE
jgi:serine protease Do